MTTDLSAEQSVAADALMSYDFVVVYAGNEWHIADPMDDEDGFYLHDPDPSIVIEARDHLLEDLEV